MDEIDGILVRAWLLALEDTTEEVDKEIEALLPPLVAAGFVQVDANTWRFTPKGAARADALLPDADKLTIAARFDPPEARRRYELWRERNADVLSTVRNEQFRLDVGRATGGDFIRVWLPIEAAAQCHVGEHS